MANAFKADKDMLTWRDNGVVSQRRRPRRADKGEGGNE